MVAASTRFGVQAFGSDIWSEIISFALDHSQKNNSDEYTVVLSAALKLQVRALELLKISLRPGKSVDTVCDDRHFGSFDH